MSFGEGQYNQIKRENSAFLKGLLPGLSLSTVQGWNSEGLSVP